MPDTVPTRDQLSNCGELRFMGTWSRFVAAERSARQRPLSRLQRAMTRPNGDSGISTVINGNGRPTSCNMIDRTRRTGPYGIRRRCGPRPRSGEANDTSSANAHAARGGAGVPVASRRRIQLLLSRVVLLPQVVIGCGGQSRLTVVGRSHRRWWQSVEWLPRRAVLPHVTEGLVYR